MNKFLNYFYIIDIFKTPLTLLFEKRRFISTKFGLLCSFGIFSIVIIMIINSDIFEKALPQIVSRNLPLTHRPLHILDKKIIAIGVQDDEFFKGFIDPTYYTVKLKNFVYFLNSSGEFERKIIEKEFHACSEADFDDPSAFKELGLNNNLCLNKEDNIIQIEGFFDESLVQFANIHLYLCDNSTKNNTCKSYEQMKKKLNGMTFNIYFNDTIVDAQDYEYPVKHTIRNKYLYINVDSYKNLELNFQKISLSSDDGWLFSNIKYYTEIAFSSQISDFFSIQESDFKASRSCFQIYSEKNMQKITRQYLKISDLLAKIGGIMQGLILICYVFVYIEQSLFLKNRILNSLYVFQAENKPINKFNLPLTRIKPLYIPRDHEELSTNNPGNNDDSSNSKQNRDNIISENSIKRKQWAISSLLRQTKKIIQFQDLKNKSSIAQNLNFGIFKYLILKIKEFFPCIKLRYEEELFKKSEKVYEKELDFIEILKKLQEFEKLKKILLNPNQLILFNFLAKPLLHINQNISQSEERSLNSINLNIVKRSDNELKTALEYYDNKKKMNNISEIDERLLVLLNEDIAHF